MKHQIRWFAAQFIVIVAGVLAALAVDAWTTRSARAADEIFYLRQLHGELAATEASLQGSIEAMSGSVHASSSLLKAFRQPAAAFPDSLARWFAAVGWYSTPSVSLGVTRALVSGQLTVVSDDSLRGALPPLLDFAEAYRNMQQLSHATFIDYSNQLRTKAPFSQRLATLSAVDSGLMSRMYSEFPFDEDRVTAFPAEYRALLADRETYVIIDGLFDYGSDLRTFQRLMLSSIVPVREMVERRLATAD